MQDILDESFEEDKPKITKRADAQKARRHLKIGCIPFGICILPALFTGGLMS